MGLSLTYSDDVGVDDGDDIIENLAIFPDQVPVTLINSDTGYSP